MVPAAIPVFTYLVFYHLFKSPQPIPRSDTADERTERLDLKIGHHDKCPIDRQKSEMPYCYG